MPYFPQSTDPAQYAQYLLESYAASCGGTYVDESLGSYVTSLLKQEECDRGEDTGSREALVELLQEHCNLSEQLAIAALDQIQEVLTYGNPMYHTEPHNNEQYLQASSLHDADILMPGDLLGALGEEGIGEQPHQETSVHDPFPPLGQDEFPPLDAAAATTSLSATSKSKVKVPRGKKAASIKIDAVDLAASLFKPTRSRQNSVDESGNSPLLHPQSISPQQEVYQQQQQCLQQPPPLLYNSVPFESALEILLSMNPESLSEEAAAAACVTADNDVNLAQYLVEQAVAAPPVCRHLLSAGCYRADCQYSHDLEHHTCLFWMRGRCGKGQACKFMHGFHQDLLQHIYSTSNSNLQSTVDVVSTSLNEPEQARFARGSDMGYSEYGLPPGWSGNTMNITPPPASFANVAKGTWTNQEKEYTTASSRAGGGVVITSSTNNVPTTKIPIDVWTPHDHRDASVFHIADPMERYKHVQDKSKRDDVIDLHFQSTKTFSIVLSYVLPEKLGKFPQVWIVTGTGHHVGSKTHQKGGGALENAVIQWLQEEGYNFTRGRDRNGQGGAILVEHS
jgi:Smr domain